MKPDSARSLLIVGRGYTKPAHFPQCDETWTTLACVNDDASLLHLPNLRVWDCHDIENVYHVPVYDIRADSEQWLEHVHTHGRTFANLFCWMLADLSTYPVQFYTVVLYGMKMSDVEYQHQAQFVAYHIGYLRARGVSVVIEQPSHLLPPAVYGIVES